jgi:hypothetical protein
MPGGHVRTLCREAACYPGRQKSSRYYVTFFTGEVCTGDCRLPEGSPQGAQAASQGAETRGAAAADLCLLLLPERLQGSL